jgi:mannose-6-phosphate isomerase-like protein (cupin superfamily)
MPKTVRRAAAAIAPAKPTAEDRPVETGLQLPFEFATFTEIPAVPCPCGKSRRAFRRDDNRVCSVHVVEISQDARAHYHKAQTETYYFLEGEGQMELEGKLYNVRPGMALMIRPGTRHRAVVGREPMKILNIVVPPFDADDEWFD